MTEGEALALLRGDDPVDVARAEQALWQMWTRSGIAEVDGLLVEGVQAMERHDFDEAERIFSRIVARAPDFAEGWNKRATVRYLAENYEGAIADCERRSPGSLTHLGRCRARDSATWLSAAPRGPPRSSGARSRSIPTSTPPAATSASPSARP